MPNCVSRLGPLLPALLLVSCGAQQTGPDPHHSSPPPGTPPGADAGSPAPTGDGAVAGEGATRADGGAPTSPPPNGPPGRPGCALPAAAFCDTLATPSPGGRSGDLDDAKWSVTRVSNMVNPGQGNWVTYPLGTGLICGKTVSGIIPPDDYQICTDSNGPHLTQTADDGGGNVVSSFRPRQPFDFTGRTGVIAFDLGGKQAGGHGFWPEIMITSEPSPAPYQDLIGIFPFPRNAIGVEIANQPSCEYPNAPAYTRNGVSAVKVIRDYVVSSWGPNDLQADYGGTGKLGDPPCFPVEDEHMNHFELRISASSVELWVSDPGADAKALRLVTKKDGLNLPFSRGYVNFQQAHYNAGKDDHVNIPKTHTFNWANIGFDGPVLPAERGYDVPNALTLFRDGSPNLGYQITASKPLAFPLAAMDLSGAVSASLHLNVYGFFTGRILQFRFNGGAWQDFASDLPMGKEQRSLEIPVPMPLLRAGDNMLEVRAGADVQDIVGANFDVSLR